MSDEIVKVVIGKQDPVKIRGKTTLRDLLRDMSQTSAEMVASGNKAENSFAQNESRGGTIRQDSF